MDLSKLNWCSHFNFPDYEVSNFGQVRRKSDHHIMKCYHNNHGYCAMKLKNQYGKMQHYLVHRLVAECYIINFLSKEQINHIDGNKDNNHISNLEWVTSQENIIHARRTGLNPYNKPTYGKKQTGKKTSASRYFVSSSSGILLYPPGIPQISFAFLYAFIHLSISSGSEQYGETGTPLKSISI